MLHLHLKFFMCTEPLSHLRFFAGLCPSFLYITSARHTDIGRTLLVAVMSVLSVRLLLPDCTDIGRTLLVGVISVLSVMLLLPDCTDIGKTLLVGVMSVLSVRLLLQYLKNVSLISS